MWQNINISRNLSEGYWKFLARFLQLFYKFEITSLNIKKN